LLIGFDDECLVCNRFVHFVINNDSKNSKIKFFPLNSNLAQKLIGNEITKDSIYVSIDNKINSEYGAISIILKKLKFPYSLLGYTMSFFPRKIGNLFYKVFSKNRYLFGKSDRCLIQSSNKSYFIID
jgi:predicted DCC family thiol-disulfide oxidoreductase YuxK